MCPKAAPLVMAAFCLTCSLDTAIAFSVSGVDLHSPLATKRIGSTRLFNGQSSIASSVIESGSVPIVPINANSEPSSSLSFDSGTAPTKAMHVTEKDESVPSTWSQALRRFFIGDVGPPLVVLSISGFIYSRLQLSIPFSIAEGAIFSSTVLFWWIQEYFFHRVLLHSPFDWLGKSIHEGHHEKDYFHVSIDPPALLLGWLFTAHLLLKTMLPWHYCLSATIGYAMAGLVYEWSHYIVHTKVKPPSQIMDAKESNIGNPVVSALSALFSQMRNNHIRHHLVDDRYWYAFSVPAMDDLFRTNPEVKDVRSSNSKR